MRARWAARPCLHHAQSRQARIVRARDVDYLNDFPRLDIGGYRVLHLDGHQPDAALHYAQACRQAGVLTSLDGGGVRENTDELLRHIDVAVCAERMCEQLGLAPSGLLELLKRAAAVLARSPWANAACSGMTRPERWMSCLRWTCRPPASSTLRGPGMCSTRLRLVLSEPAGAALGRAFHLRARGFGPQDPASGQ